MKNKNNKGRSKVQKKLSLVKRRGNFLPHVIRASQNLKILVNRLSFQMSNMKLKRNKILIMAAQDFLV